MDFQKKYNNKEILVIGGGTSTLDTNWENIINPDTFIWTCNDFYMNDKVCSKDIDLYQLGYLTNLEDVKLRDKLRSGNTFTYYEPEHYRGKQNSEEFKAFCKAIGFSPYSMKIDYSNLENYGYRPAQKSGAVLRLILLALSTRARRVFFVGFDGFNKEFTNKHAFTGHPGLKDTDTRRDWDEGPMSYVSVFEDAYRLLASREDCKRLQNLGEGLDYNLGTRLSKEYFPLTSEVYEAVR
jgi:hypothetical protein